MILNRRSIIVIIWIVSLLVAGRSSPVRAQSDEEIAFHIYDLARALYYENADLDDFTSWVNGDIGKNHAGVPTRLKTGQPMPDFSFKVFNGQDTLTRASLKGPYILNFWASWCPPCRDEFPLIVKSIDDKDLTAPVIFVNTLDKKPDAQRFLQSFPTDLTIVTDDAKSTYTHKVGIDAIPQTVVVDSEGNVQAIHTGGMTDLTIAFLEAISQHPGLGGFDSNDPDQPPEDMPTGQPTASPAGQ